MKVEVISKDSIKPSSPTPDHLQILQFSFLDQIAPPVFMPIVLFYPTTIGDTKLHTTIDKCDHLKQSLSKALVQLYPLAGRVVDNQFVECNDEGVHFLIAQADCPISQVIEPQEPSELNKLLPCELDNVGDLVLAIQATAFSCGGIAIGVCISHKVVDALSMVTFVNTWAATARGDGEIMSPHFGLSTLFPPKELSGYYKPNTGIIKDRIVTKRFVFDSSMIASLRARYTGGKNSENPRRPTRIEALSIFVWSRIVAATQGQGGGRGEPGKHNTMLHAVNLRTRMDPPLPEYYFGNLISFAIAAPSMDSEEEESYGFVNGMRDAIKRINGDYVRRLQEGSEYLSFLKDRAKRVAEGEVVSFSFTSLCRFPLYEADFGWGKPVWVGSASLAFKNLVVFMDTKSGNGIEAWVNLKAEDMAKFEVDKEFLEFVLPPSGSPGLINLAN